jgi:hypothetical protein
MWVLNQCLLPMQPWCCTQFPSFSGCLYLQPVWWFMQFFFVAQQLNSGLGLLVIQVSRSQTIRHIHPLGLLWTSDRLIPEAATNTSDKDPCPRRAQSQQHTSDHTANIISSLYNTVSSFPALYILLTSLQWPWHKVTLLRLTLPAYYLTFIGYTWHYCNMHAWHKWTSTAFLLLQYCHPTFKCSQQPRKTTRFKTSYHQTTKINDI